MDAIVVEGLEFLGPNGAGKPVGGAADAGGDPLHDAYAPQDLLQGWHQEVARLNPMTQVVEGTRQACISDSFAK